MKIQRSNTTLPARFLHIEIERMEQSEPPDEVMLRRMNCPCCGRGLLMRHKPMQVRLVAMTHGSEYESEEGGEIVRSVAYIHLDCAPLKWVQEVMHGRASVSGPESDNVLSEYNRARSIKDYIEQVTGRKSNKEGNSRGGFDAGVR